MKTKNKYLIGFWIAASLFVIMTIAFVGVLAAFNANTQGGQISISYSAVHVNAEITAGYKIKGESSYTQLKVSNATPETTTMTFDDDSIATKTFENTPDLAFTRTKNYAYFKYTVKNTGSTNIQVGKSISENKTGDITITYASVTDSTTEPTTWKTTADEALAENTAITPGSTLYFYVKIEMPENHTDSVDFDGSYNFTLYAQEL